MNCPTWYEAMATRSTRPPDRGRSLEQACPGEIRTRSGFATAPPALACRRSVVADSASMQHSRRSGLRAKPATRAEDVPRELDLTRLEHSLAIAPLVDGVDGFVDRARFVVNRHPVHRGEQLHAERGLDPLCQRHLRQSHPDISVAMGTATRPPRETRNAMWLNGHGDSAPTWDAQAGCGSKHQSLAARSPDGPCTRRGCAAANHGHHDPRVVRDHGLASLWIDGDVPHAAQPTLRRRVPGQGSLPASHRASLNAWRVA